MDYRALPSSLKVEIIDVILNQIINLSPQCLEVVGDVQRRCCLNAVMCDEMTVGDVSEGWMSRFGNPLAFMRGTLGMDFGS